MESQNDVNSNLNSIYKNLIKINKVLNETEIFLQNEQNDYAKTFINNAIKYHKKIEKEKTRVSSTPKFAETCFNDIKE